MRRKLEVEFSMKDLCERLRPPDVPSHARLIEHSLGYERNQSQRDAYPDRIHLAWEWDVREEPNPYRANADLSD